MKNMYPEQFYSSETESFLYHYTSWESAFLHILPLGKIRLSKLTKTNDPAEFSDYYPENFISKDHKEGMYNYEKGCEILALRDNIKLICFCYDKKAQNKSLFGKGFLRSRMWSQYAKDQTGVCIVFNKESIIECIKQAIYPRKLLHGKVTYTNELQINKLLVNDNKVDNKKYIESNYRGFILQKLKDYKDENEYRVCFLDDEERDFFEIDIYRHSIKAVIAGIRTPYPVLQSLATQCLKHECDLFQLMYLNGEYTLQVPLFIKLR